MWKNIIILIIILIILFLFYKNKENYVEYKLDKHHEIHDDWIRNHITFKESYKNQISKYSEILKTEIKKQNKYKKIIEHFLKHNDVSTLFEVPKIIEIKTSNDKNVLDIFVKINKINKFFYTNYIKNISKTSKINYKFNKKVNSNLIDDEYNYDFKNIINSFFENNINYLNNIIQHIKKFNQNIGFEELELTCYNNLTNKSYVRRLLLEKYNNNYYILRGIYHDIALSFLDILNILSQAECYPPYNFEKQKENCNDTSNKFFSLSESCKNNIINEEYFNNKLEYHYLNIEKFFIKILNDEIFLKPIVDEGLPCFFYDALHCPLQKNINNIQKCSNDLDSNTCFAHEDNINYNLLVDNCEAFSHYGKNVCENIVHKSNKLCKFNTQNKKCNNPNIINNDLKCNEIDVNDQSNIAFCKSKGCKFKSVTLENSDGGEINTNICYDKNDKKNRHFLTKLNKDKDIDTNVTTPINEQVKNKCYYYDNSDYKNDGNLKNSSEILKASDEVLKHLCETEEENGEKCKYIEYPSYNKNKNFSKCLPENQFQTIKQNKNITNVLNTPDLISYCPTENRVNDKCIDYNKKCNDIIYKGVCDVKDDCSWYSTNYKNQEENNGYCVTSNMADAKNVTNDILKIHNDKILFNQSLQYDVKKIHDQLINIEKF